MTDGRVLTKLDPYSAPAFRLAYHSLLISVPPIDHSEILEPASIFLTPTWKRGRNCGDYTYDLHNLPEKRGYVGQSRTSMKSLLCTECFTKLLLLVLVM